jgi:hypothetical protein
MSTLCVVGRRREALDAVAMAAPRWSGKVLILSAAVGMALHPAMVAAQPNPVVIENQQPGTTDWQIPWGRAGNDVQGQIKGYASATSVNKGENITFFISTYPAQAYTIDVFRVGWYQGLGGRLMQRVGPLVGVQQPICPTNAPTGLIECQWTPAFTLATQTTWTSGVYLALLTNAQNYQNYIVFVVRDDSRVAALLYQQPVTTYQAYNDYPYDTTSGKSLYEFNSYGATTMSGLAAAVKVSFDRPYMGDGVGRAWGNFILWEVAFIRWLEKSGYDVAYSTDLDLHTDGSRLLNYRGLLSVGHDEYWSKPMYDAVIAARDAGVNLGFFGANAVYTQVRFEASSTGTPNRVMVCYRTASLDPVTDPTLKAVNWRDQPVNRPEQTLLGTQYTSQVMWQQQYDGYSPYVVTNSANWVYAGTGFVDGDSVPGIVGYEADRWFSESPQPTAVSGTYALLSNSPYTTNTNIADRSNASIYQAPSGAWVFAAATMGWSRALDNYTGWNVVDARIQKVTANILDRFVGPGGPLRPSPPSAAVAYDNNVSSGIQWGVSTVTTPAFAVGSGVNRAAMIMVTMSTNTATNITASLGGVTGTVIPGTDSGTTASMRALIFQVINPPSGAQTATVSWTDVPMNANVGVITVSGADQTTPCTNGIFAASDSTPSATTSVTITSSPGDLTASVGYTGDGWIPPFTNQSLRWGVDSGESGGDVGPGTGATTHAWTDWYYWQTHAVSGANFKAAR